MVIDDGWEANSQGGEYRGDPWDRTNPRFGSSMPEIARRIHALRARPGLWYRPLIAARNDPDAWRLKGRHDALDPTVPEVLAQVTTDIRRFRGWGYELIKHDYSTYDITGLWGKDMGASMARDGWSFADSSRTTAEVILNLYRTIRQAAGNDVLVDGCNTVSHLAAGQFELQRIGDDTSGQEWDRTRQMGVNCLAFRAAQHGTFYAVDADCAGLAKAGAVPWEKNRQWLDLLARSGTPLMVSWPEALLGAREARDRRGVYHGVHVAARGRTAGLDADAHPGPLETPGTGPDVCVVDILDKVGAATNCWSSLKNGGYLTARVTWQESPKGVLFSTLRIAQLDHRLSCNRMGGCRDGSVNPEGLLGLRLACRCEGWPEKMIG